MGSKEQFPQELNKSMHKNLPMRALSRVSPDYRPPISPQTQRAVYIFLRPCVQTFKGLCTRYLNLPLRLIYKRTEISHWGFLISTELPSTDTRPGKKCTLKEPWERTCYPVELDVPDLDEAAKGVNVGSFEHLFPTTQTTQKKFIYVGTTTLMNDEIHEKAEVVVEFLRKEGGYHGIYRNCQHFIQILSSFMFDSEGREIRLPKRADQCLGGVLWLGMWKFRDINKRIKNARALYEEALQEKERLSRSDNTTLAERDW
jgi:hypothetical protein